MHPAELQPSVSLNYNSQVVDQSTLNTQASWVGMGSTSLITDSTGVKTNEQRYKAWGETRYTFGNEKTKYQYTGQYSYVSDFGLHFYNARWYDPYLNHFTQPDTIVPDPYNPQDWNRYSYARNNPLQYTDPSGHSADCAVGSHGCSVAKVTPRARVFYLNGLGGTESLTPQMSANNEYASSLYWISQAVGGENLIHIALFTSPSEKWPARFDMLGEALGIKPDWTDKALEEIRSELESNPLDDGEKLVIVGASAGGTVAAELLDDLAGDGIFVDQLILRGSPVIELNLTNVGEVDYIAAENPLSDLYYSIDVNPFDAAQVQVHRVPGLTEHTPRGLELMNKIGALIVDLIEK